MISPQRLDHFSKSSTNGVTPPTSELGIDFKDEKFEVIPIPGKVAPSEGQDTSEAKAPGSSPPGSPGSSGMDYTEEDLLFITETFWNLPCIFLDKLPPRDPEKLKKFNTQFFKYCRKKGINPWDYFFDEFPLAMAGIGMGMGIWRDYKEQYKSNGKKESKEEKKLSSDYEHDKQVAEQKQKDIQAGKITTAPPEAAPGAAGAG